MWKYYYPDEGETEEDAHIISDKITLYDAESAAQEACERDYDCHDGWERGDTEFVIAVISPDGEIFRFKAQHEPSVEHRVYEDS